MNERLYDENDLVITGMNGETVGELPENPETFTEDDLRIRAVIKQAFNEALTEMVLENPTASVFRLAAFENIFLTKCWQYLSSKEYAAVERWWIAYRDGTLFADREAITLFADREAILGESVKE